MSQFSYIDDAYQSINVNPFAASDFSAEVGSYSLFNTAPDPTPQNTMVPRDYCIENVAPIQIKQDACGLPTTNFSGANGVDPWNLPYEAKQPPRLKRRRRRVRRGAQVATDDDRSSQCELSRVQAQNVPLCTVDSIIGTMGDLINWSNVDFPADRVDFVSKLLYVFTRNDRHVYVLGASILALLLARILRR